MREKFDRSQPPPKHVAIIMDGNGRWAKRQFLPRIVGHRKGAERVREVLELAAELKIETLTLYAFSEENWQRPEDEVRGLMQLLENSLLKEISELHKNDVRFRVIGDRSKLEPRIQTLISDGEALMSNNSGIQLILALSYGSRSEIVGATQKLAAQVLSGELSLAEITPERFCAALQTEGVPDPDLLIRTSGEQRISNFLLWQLAYTELYFSPVLWPDFDSNRFMDALVAYQQRDRRFGQVEGPLGSMAATFRGRVRGVYGDA